MNNTQHALSDRFHLSVRLILCSCVLWLFSTNAHSNNLHISADIAPIHSLVSMVAGDQQDVDLIIPSNQSPHDFALKPSQIRALSKADLVVIVSDAFSPSLSRHLQALHPEQVVLSLSGAQRSDAAQEAKDHEIKTRGNNAQEKDHSAHADEHLLHDVHTWLNPLNAIVWIDYIATALATLDEPNRAKYEANATTAVAELNQLHQTSLDQLASVSTEQYVVYHDAYRHFAHTFNLADPQPIALSDARAPGAAQLSRMRQVAQNSTCIFSELQHDDAIVDTISAGLGLKRGILDPLGSEIPAGPKLYTELIHTLVQRFYECLSD